MDMHLNPLGLWRFSSRTVLQLTEQVTRQTAPHEISIYRGRWNKRPASRKQT
jgi:hypothetical protein